jgi:hypothetical protein
VKSNARSEWKCVSEATITIAGSAAPRLHSTRRDRADRGDAPVEREQHDRDDDQRERVDLDQDMSGIR